MVAGLYRRLTQTQQVKLTVQHVRLTSLHETKQHAHLLHQTELAHLGQPVNGRLFQMQHRCSLAQVSNHDQTPRQ